MERQITQMIDYLTLASQALESALQENRPDSNDINDTLEYDRQIASLKEIKKLIKKLKNGKSN